MQLHPQNPADNVLGAGVTSEDLEAAIARSGYPLQSEVVDTILRTLEDRATLRSVQEEWSYVDQDEGVVRQLDALVSFELDPLEATYDPGRPDDPAAYLRGGLDFLVECKQSELPFVFFLRPSQVSNMPRLVGLPHMDITIHTSADDPGMISMSAFDVLGCYDLSLASHDRVAIAMTRVHRKGKALELSGEEAYRALTLPLLKALAYYEDRVKPSQRALYFDVRTVVPIVVLKAPLISVHMEGGLPHLEAVPSVRLNRHEPGDDGDFRGRTLPDAIDVVHVGFLPQYLDLAVQTASTLIERARAFAPQLLTGAARWEGDSYGEAHEEKSPQEEGPPFETLAPHLSDHGIQEWLDLRWRAAHSADVDKPAASSNTAGDRHPDGDDH